MDNTLKGKRALVTGASRGIGSAIALTLAESGVEVIVHFASNRATAQSVADRIAAQGGKASIIQADLSHPDGAEGLAALAGPVDILILNASVQIRRSWEKISRADFDTQVNCNFFSSMRLMQQAAPYMRARKWGRIVAIGSVQEAKPHPDMLVYSATKAAQTMMVKSLALQLASDGVTVNSVAPGVISTDRNTEALSDPIYARKVMETIPMGYWGEKEDCAGIVRFLCSEEGRYITGQSIYVDGGKSL